MNQTEKNQLFLKFEELYYLKKLFLSNQTPHNRFKCLYMDAAYGPS